MKRLAVALLLLLCASAAVFGQDPCPPKPSVQEGFKQIENDPRFTKIKFRTGIGPATALKQELTPGMIASMNYLYGWDLPANKECFDVKQNGNLIYEIVISPNYDKAVFLASVEKAEALLKKTRQSGEIAQFNKQYGAKIPANGPLSNEEAERLIYQIVGKSGAFTPNVDSANSGNARPTQTPTTQTPPRVVPQDHKPAGTPGRGNMLLYAGGALVLSLLAFFWFRRKNEKTPAKPSHSKPSKSAT